MAEELAHHSIRHDTMALQLGGQGDGFADMSKHGVLALKQKEQH
jgi:hypothetical protein